MSKRFGYGETDLFEWVEDNGKMISTKECVEELNELSEEKEYFERKKEYFLSKWSIVNAKNIQLRQEIKELKKENEQLKKKIKPSIYNKKDGDWKWNVDNNTILNIRTGEIFYLRNSGAVENLVHLLNKLEQISSENEKMLQKDLNMITELRRENEQLKKQLDLRTESDKYHKRMLLKWLCIDEDEE